MEAGTRHMHSMYTAEQTGYEYVTYFSGNPLDRQSELRRNEEYIIQSMKSEKARFILFSGQMPLIEQEELCDDVDVLTYKNLRERFFALKERYYLKRLKFADVKALIPAFGENIERPLTIYLGFGSGEKQDKNEVTEDDDLHRTPSNNTADGFFWFAIDVTKTDITDKIMEEYPNALIPIRPVLLLLKENEASIAAQAKSILAWHERYSSCPTCGSKTTVQEAGYKRWCTNSSCQSRKGVHNTCFPRLDPAVAMVISSPDGERLLLCRKRTHDMNVYTCLEGYMEPGETVEEAVRREVKEESGIIVGKVEYKFSQPWPFPAVLIIGCFGQALSEEITVCTEELEDVQWFDKAYVYDALTKTHSSNDGSLRFLPSQTMAHQLLRHWCIANGLTPAISKM